MRVSCLKPFMARRDNGTERQLLAVGELVTLSGDDPHTKTLLSEGYAAEVKAEKPAASPKPPKADA